MSKVNLYTSPRHSLEHWKRFTSSADNRFMRAIPFSPWTKRRKKRHAIRRKRRWFYPKRNICARKNCIARDQQRPRILTARVRRGIKIDSAWLRQNGILIRRNKLLHKRA